MSTHNICFLVLKKEHLNLSCGVTSLVLVWVYSLLLTGIELFEIWPV